MIKIEITGPGTTFGRQLLIIKEALEAEGYSLNIKDNYPPEYSLKEHRDHHNKNNVKLSEIEIITHHEPWGG